MTRRHQGLGCLVPALLGSFAPAAFAQPAAGLPPPSAEARLPEPRTDLPKVLITGYRPFGPWRSNPSWDGARRLQGVEIAGHEVIAVELPVEYGPVWRSLPELLRRYRPEAVLHFGMNPRADSSLVIERRARNGRYYTPDAARVALAPRCRGVVADDDFWRYATAPAAALREAFAAAGLPARESDDAGYYLCEFTLFASLHHQAALGGRAPTGFVHVPASWPLERIEQAMRIAVDVTLRGASRSPPRAAPPTSEGDPAPARGYCDLLR